MRRHRRSRCVCRKKRSSDCRSSLKN